MRITRAVLMLVFLMAPAHCLPAVTTTVLEVPVASGSIRVLYQRPDARIATLISLTGGDGILGILPNGQGATDNFNGAPITRNRQRLTDLGYAVAMVDVSTEQRVNGGLTNAFRATQSHLVDLQAVVQRVRSLSSTPVWIVGYSAGTISAANLAINQPHEPPFGVMLLAPVTVDDGSLLAMNLAAIRRPTVILSHASDPCGVTPPDNVPQVLARLTGAPVKDHVQLSGGTQGVPGQCDRTGYHGWGGLDAEFVGTLSQWVRSHSSLLSAPNFQALWWRSPAQSESGWGVNVTHQGDILFATWFTYDTDGQGMWLVMSEGRRAGAGANTYTGALYRTTGPAFNSPTFDPAQVTAAAVGTATFTFSDADNGTFLYTVNGITQTKPIVRQNYALPVPACTADAGAPSSTNFQDLWWRSPAGSESGWGVNLTHQGDVIFATWFTYGPGGRGMWLVMSEGRRTTGNTYSGKLYRTTGPAFSASPWNPAQVAVTEVGTATFTFSDASNGTFAYSVDGVSQTKAISRQVFSSPPTVCR
jgi:hypothetical protein